MRYLIITESIVIILLIKNIVFFRDLVTFYTLAISYFLRYVKSYKDLTSIEIISYDLLMENIYSQFYSTSPLIYKSLSIDPFL
jgi:hypothetical protein